MPKTRKTLSKEVLQMKLLLRDSVPFTEPVATSSPNIEKKGNSLHLTASLWMLCEKVIQEERSLKETLEEDIKTRFQLLLYEVNPDQEFYSCTVDDSVKINKNKNKRLREDEPPPMPPPSVTRVEGVKKGKKARTDSEDLGPLKARQLPTRCSSRLKEQSICAGTSGLKLEVPPANDYSVFKTPLSKGSYARKKHNIALVTPGPNVNAPQTILRRPNAGETAISLAGSPLLVSSEQTSCVPQITIPLRDGRVMAVLAKDGLNPEDFPTMDSHTLSRLKMLHEFLGKL